MDKDPLFGFRNTIIDKDSKGRDTLTLYMNQEKVPKLIETLQGLVSNEGGVKLKFHTEDKVNSATGHSFKSTFGFVKGVDGKGPAKRVATPKEPNNAEDVFNKLSGSSANGKSIA